MWIERYTIVDGTAPVGVYAADGSFNVVDSAEETGFVGIYHPCGAYWVTFIAEPTDEAYAPNGSLYAVEEA